MEHGYVPAHSTHKKTQNINITTSNLCSNQDKFAGKNIEAKENCNFLLNRGGKRNIIIRRDI